jgi:predicted CoA-binding protein
LFSLKSRRNNRIIFKEMPQEHLLQVSPEIAANEMLLKEYLGKLLKIAQKIQHVAILKRSIDARQRRLK